MCKWHPDRQSSMQRKLTSTESKLLLDPFTAWNTNCLILDNLTPVTTYSLKSTTAETHYSTIRLRVQCATWEVDQQSLWFQQEHSVRTAGPWSMQDIWFPLGQEAQTPTSAAATCVGTNHQKSQMAEHHKTKHSSTLLKSTVDHCRVHCMSLEVSWPAWFALSDELLLNTG